MRRSKEPRLEIEQRGEVGIQTMYAVCVRHRDGRDEVTAVKVGSFDCMPYEPRQLAWSFIVELHRDREGKLGIVTVETEKETVVEDGDWVDHERRERRVHVLGDDGWCVMDGEDGFGAATLLASEQRSR